MGNQEGVHRLQFHAESSFQICSTDRHFEVVSISATINVETPLIGLVADTIFDFGAEHQLVASHIIVHNIIQISNTFLTINPVKVNLLVSGDLEAHVAFDVEDQSSHVFDDVILLPSSLQRLFIYLDFEEEYFARASSDESLIINEKHEPKISGHAIHTE